MSEEKQRASPGGGVVERRRRRAGASAAESSPDHGDSSGGRETFPLTRCRAEDLAKITGGRWLEFPAPDWRPSSLAFINATVRQRSLLIPKTSTFCNGVDLWSLMPFKRWNCAVLVDKSTAQLTRYPRLQVESATDAVAILARHMRDNFAGTILAVTGSVGKTSTCALLHHTLSGLGTCAALHTLNMQDGTSAQLANLSDEDFCVLEIAGPENVGPASRIARPHVAVLTAIAPAHLIHADSLHKIARLKACIFDWLEPGGVAVINRSVPHFEQIHDKARRNAGKIVTYGDHPEADIRLLNYDVDSQVVSASVCGEEISYPMSVAGRHMAVNSLAVLAAVYGLAFEWRGAASYLGRKTLPPGRGSHHRATIAGKQILLIDDAYNANPASMKAAIEVLAQIEPASGGERVAVLGDMLELGAEEARYHAELAQSIAEAGIDRVYVSGPLMSHLWEQLPVHIRGRKGKSAKHLIRVLKRELGHGDVALFKGSNATNIFAVASALRDLDENNPTPRPRADLGSFARLYT